MKRYHIPALVMIGVIATCAAITLHHAYEEGRDCRSRGGVIIESDANDDTAVATKACTADY